MHTVKIRRNANRVSVIALLLIFITISSSHFSPPIKIPPGGLGSRLVFEHQHRAFPRNEIEKKMNSQTSNRFIKAYAEIATAKMRKNATIKIYTNPLVLIGTDKLREVNTKKTIAKPLEKNVTPGVTAGRVPTNPPVKTTEPSTTKDVSPEDHGSNETICVHDWVLMGYRYTWNGWYAYYRCSRCGKVRVDFHYY